MNPGPDAERQLGSLALAVVLLEPGLAVQSANPAAEQLLGISAKRMVGRRIQDLLEIEEARILAWMEQGDAPLSAHAVEASVAGHAYSRGGNFMMPQPPSLIAVGTDTNSYHRAG